MPGPGRSRQERLGFEGDADLSCVGTEEPCGRMATLEEVLPTPERARPLLRDVDAGARAQTVEIVTWSMAGGLIGLVAGVGLAILTHGHVILYPTLGALLGWTSLFVAIRALVGAVGGVAGGLLSPSTGLARRTDLSLSESLVIRGSFDEALAVLDDAVAEDQERSEAYFKAGGIARDHLKDGAAAERWFKRARSEATLSPSQERLVCRELIELYRTIGSPERAAPELARLAELADGSAEGQWAREELARLRRLLSRQERAPGDAGQE